MSTNANSILKDAKVGTFTGLVTEKKGVERGPKGNKTVFGNDVVHVCVFTGFKYDSLVQRSLDTLATISDADVLADAQAKGIKAWSGRGKKAIEVELTLADFAAARAELVDSFTRTLDPNQESTSTTKHVYEPLTVDGESVRGGRVYKCVAGETDDDGNARECQCRNCTGDAKAPKPGTIYLQGLQVSSRVLTPAPNGPAPKPQSAAKTVAKDMLRRCLPISRYVSYRLEPGTDFLLRAGGTAAVQAEQDGIHFTPEVRDAIKRSKAA
jgi:hypothetical protein